MDNVKQIPHVLSATNTTDEDSGLKTFRGMASPWDEIKGFKETYQFYFDNTALLYGAYMNALDIVIPDPVEKMDAYSDTYLNMLGNAMDQDDPYGIIQAQRDMVDVPPFMDGSIYPANAIVDMSDEAMMITGYTWYCADERSEKEMHFCPIALSGQNLCDMSDCLGGNRMIPGLAKEDVNFYSLERLGDGDSCCLDIYGSRDSFGCHTKSKEHHIWEMGADPASGHRPLNMQRPYDLRRYEPEFLTTGVFSSCLGHVHTAGDMYKVALAAELSYVQWAITTIKNASKDEAELARNWNTLYKVLDIAGKHLFGTREARWATKRWMGAPEGMKDGRLLGAYISMIFQAHTVPVEFAEFTDKRVVVEVDRARCEFKGAYPEISDGWRAYFNGMGKALMDPSWRVSVERDETVVRFVIDQGPDTTRRYKPKYDPETGELVK